MRKTLKHFFANHAIGSVVTLFIAQGIIQTALIMLAIVFLADVDNVAIIKTAASLATKIAVLFLLIYLFRPFPEKPTPPISFILYSLIGITFYVLNTAILQVFQIPIEENINHGAIPLLLTTISSILVAPVLEEILYRKVTMDILLQKYGSMVSVVVSASLFCLAHSFNNQSPFVFVHGLLAATLYLRLRKILPIIFIHAGFNICATSAIYSPDLFNFIDSYPAVSFLFATSGLVAFFYFATLLERSLNE